MKYTDILQSCKAVTVDNVVRYRIGLTVQTAGELPHRNIYVYHIQSKDNPATDEFTRVATVDDMSQFQLEREDAVAREEEYYLSFVVEFYYADVNVAISAKEALTTRINDLINTWIVYQDGFTNTDGQVTSYPTADPGYEAELVRIYTDAKASRIAAEKDIVASDLKVTTAKLELKNANKIYTIYTDTCVLISTLYVNPEGGELGVYRSKILDMGVDAESYWSSTVKPSLDTLTNAVCPNVGLQAGVVAAAEGAVSTALAEKKEKTIDLEAAQAAEDEALANLLVVCPDFDTTSV